MTTNITNHTDLRIELENKTIRDIASTTTGEGFAAIRLTMHDGSVVYVESRTRNGIATLQVEKW